MKTRIYGALIAATLSSNTAIAADRDSELQTIREQLERLIQRVDHLERENAELKKHADAIVASQPPESSSQKPATSAPAKTADPRIILRGDVRYRFQNTDDARASAERHEHVLRARASIEAQVTDSLTAGLGLSTSENGNPRGANVRLDGEFSRKPAYFDLAYVDWAFAGDAHAIIGKMKVPFARPGQSLFWDNDVNPEGVALTWSSASVFASAYGFMVEENVQAAATPSAQDTADTQLSGVQIGNRFSLGESTLTLAGMYYDLAAGRGHRPFFNGSSNGNSLDPTGALAFDFRVIEAMLEWNSTLGELPLQLWVDVAQNQDAVLDTALGAGMVLGKAARAGSWEAGLTYQLIEKDALFAQHIDSDFGGGLSDSKGWILRAGYALQKNWTVNASYFLTHANVDVGDEFDYDRLLLDFNAKF